MMNQPTHVILHVDNWDGERDIVTSLAYRGQQGEFLYWETNISVLQYQGDEILSVWELSKDKAESPQPKFKKEMPGVGALLRGGKVFSWEGVKEWYDFPRYVVILCQPNKQRFLVQALKEDGTETERNPQIFKVDSEQWELWNPQPEGK